MSQISPPMRILLAGAVVFLALWFTLLRPKSDAGPPAASTPPTGNVNTGQPAESGYGKAVEKAKDAAKQAEGAATGRAGESTADATKTAPGTATSPAAKAQAAPAVPAAELAKLPKDVAGALEAHKVLVLAVLSSDAKRWRPMADDDRYVRNTLEKVNRYDGQVVVKQVPLSGLSTYGPLVNDLDVNQTPSVVVVDRRLQANVLEGWVDRVSINQAIADARTASIRPIITDSYLRKVNSVCSNFRVRASRWSLPTIRGDKALAASYARAVAIYHEYGRGIASIDTPKQWRSLRTAMVAHLGRQERALRSAERLARHGRSTASVSAGGTAATAKLNKRFDAVGLTACSATSRE